MVDESTPDSDMKLSDFMESLYPDYEAAKTQRYDTIFRLFYDISAFNKVPSSINTFLWGMIFLTIDAFVQMLPVNVRWFQPNYNHDSFSYLYSLIASRQISLFISIVTIIILIVQWAAVLKYNKSLKVSSGMATFLYISLMHLPFYITFIQSLCFGQLMLLLVSNNDSLYSIVYVSFLILGITIIYYITSSGFWSITKYTLYLGEGLFSFWEPPFTFVDLLAIFAIFALVPFRGSNYPYVTIGSCVVSLLWGISMLYKRIRPAMLSHLANIIETKLYLDCIIFSLYSILTIWKPFNSHLKMSIYMILLVINFVIAMGLVYVKYKIFDPGFNKKGQNGFDQSRIPNANSAIASVRYNVCFASPVVTDMDFLKWIMQWRFSPEIIPDIIRLSIVMEADISNFVMPKLNVSPVQLIPLKFLAFELRFNERYRISDDDIQIRSLKEDLQIAIQHVEQVTQHFWTSLDEERRSLKDFGSEIEKTTLLIKRSVFFYPNSETITKIWQNYVCHVLYQPRKFLLVHSPIFSLLERPGYTTYGFIDSRTSAPQTTIKRSRIESKTDLIFKKFQKSTITPVIFWLSFTAVFIMCLLIPYSTFYGIFQQRLTRFSTDIGHLTILAVSISKKLLKFTDPLLNLPTPQDYMKMLNISYTDALQLRDTIDMHQPMYMSVTKYIALIQHVDIPTEDPLRCHYYSLALLTKIRYENVKTYEMRYCHFRWAKIYSSVVLDIIEGKIMGNKPPYPITNEQQILFLVLTFFVFTMVLVFLVLRQRKNLRKVKKILHNIRLMDVEEVKERKEPYIAFNPFLYAVIWVLMFVCLFAIYALYYYPTELSIKYARENLKYLILVARICSEAMIAFSASIFSIKEKDDEEFYDEAVQTSCKHLIALIQNIVQQDAKTNAQKTFLAQSQNYSLFQKIIDFANLLMSPNITEDGFPFSMARYIFLKNISEIVNSTLPQISYSTADAVFQKADVFWSASPLILVILILILSIIKAIRNYQKKWFSGACFFYRRAFYQNPETAIFHLRSILKRNETIFDDIPVPMIIRNENGVIVFANRQSTYLTGHSVEQTKGQLYSEFFDQNGPLYSVDGNGSFTADIIDMKDGYQFLIFHDTSQIQSKIEAYDELIRRTKTDVGKLPFRAQMIYIECYLNFEKVDVGSIFGKMDEVHEKFTCIHKIAAGSTFMKSIANPNNAKEAFQFVVDFASKNNNTGFVVALIEGMGTALSLTEEGSLVRIAGKINERSTDIITRGRFDHIYIDQSILSRLPQDITISPEIEKLLLPISPI